MTTLKRLASDNGSTTILVVEDDPSLREAVCDTLEMAGYPVIAAEDGRMALDQFDDQRVGMVISDVRMEGMDGHELLRRIKERSPKLPVLLMTAYGTISKAVEAIRNGAVDYLVKPFEPAVLITMVSRFVLRSDVAEKEFIAVDPRMKEIVALAHKAAPSDATILITGESGTGKEVLARYIHRNSHGSGGPFVAINCSAIPDTMLEAVLFGHEKGAYTGAYKHGPGKFELANGGTLLLDEISEMNTNLQAKILRVLQEREVERLGGNRVIPLEVRIIATSNRNLREEVAAGHFREDLFYRLNVFPIHIPPLRERPLDIIPIADWLLAKVAHVKGRPIQHLSAEARKCLMAQSWPGNVRELDNAIKRTTIMNTGAVIRADALYLEPAISQMPDKSAPGTSGNPDPQAPLWNLKTQEQNLILETLKRFMGNRKTSAEHLGISERTLRYKLARIREVGIPIPG